MPRAMFRPSRSFIPRAASTCPLIFQRCSNLQTRRALHRTLVRKNEEAHEQSYQAKRSTSLTPLMVLLGITPIVTFALGTWQIQRLQWKVDLIDDLQEKLQRAPMELPNYVK